MTRGSEGNQADSKTRIAALGLLVNLALAGAKLIAGLVGNSYALVADAVESLTDIAGSVVIWSGLRVGAKPPDADHPWGHGKAEALAALVVSGIIFLAGVGIAIEAVREILTPHHSPAPLTLIVLVAVVIVKETMYRVTRRVSQRHGSDVVAVDAFHHRSDAITSIAAFAGISLALAGPRVFGSTPERWAPADDYAAIVASGIIVLNACRLIRLPLRELMDRDVPDVIGPARALASTVAGVKEFEKCRTRSSGSRAYLEMHVQVDSEIPIREAHAIGGRVRALIRERLVNVADVLIHIEPHEPIDAAAKQAEVK